MTNDLINRGGHYYGDIVRRLFLAGGIIMLAALPFFRDYIPYPLMASIAAILIIGFFAGVIAPAQKWPIVLNAIISAIAFAVFEYHAVTAYIEAKYWFSTVNQVLAAIFFAAFYYGIKSSRGLWIKDKNAEDPFATDMLKSRYAKGEISTEEFEERKKQLEK